jgi:hypothetical protein
MRTHISILLALLASSIVAQDNTTVSREGKDIKFLVQVTAAGASTPQKLFNLAKNPEEEPKLTDYLTPLGQR